MKMIKLFFILLLYVLPTFAVAQTKNDSYTQRMTDGKNLYNEACDLWEVGNKDDAKVKLEKAKSRFKVATNYAMTEKQKDELKRWKNKCEQFPPKTPVSTAKRWTISWDEENQCIQLKSGNQTVLYNMIQVAGGKYGNDNTIMGFAIGETEITELLWNVVMKGDVAAMNLKPKTAVLKSDCDEFLNRLYEKIGVLFRLPDVDEWEYAASGGVKSKGYEYAGSNILTDVTHTDKNLHNVAEKKSNELGLFDMTGNVWELTSSPHKFGGYIIKGGCYNQAYYNYNSQLKKLKITGTDRLAEDSRDNTVGFRIVKSYE